MTLSMDNLAAKYWSVEGAAAFPGIRFGEMSEHLQDLTTLDEPTGPRYRVDRFRVKQIVGPPHREDATRTVDIKSAAELSSKAEQKKLIFSILRSEAGEAIPVAARYEAVLFLSKLPQGCALPSVSLGHGEIVFEWELGEDKSATASFEGDGFVGYAMLYDGKYLPGQADENLYDTPFPTDLAEYLSDTSIK